LKIDDSHDKKKMLVSPHELGNIFPVVAPENNLRKKGCRNAVSPAEQLAVTPLFLAKVTA
jgi:hypothetical protein